MASMPPIEWPTKSMLPMPSAANRAWVLAASPASEYWYSPGLVDLQKPSWSGAITRQPAALSALMVSSHVAAQKFLPCSSTATRPLGVPVGAASR
jgi:hypothetical protein